MSDFIVTTTGGDSNDPDVFEKNVLEARNRGFATISPRRYRRRRMNGQPIRHYRTPLADPIAPLLATGEESTYTFPANVPELLAVKIEVMKRHRHRTEDVFPGVGEWNFDDPNYAKSGEIVTADEADPA